jgi:hypothetical protein
MLIYTYQKSKKKKRETAKQRELRDSWQQLLKKYETKPMVSKSDKKPFSPPKAFVRETPHYPSLETMQGSCTKPVYGKVYTGTAMIGIGTLHKSNAVPIFNAEEALDQAKMRR